MNFEWTGKSIALYQEASTYTGFHENLAAMAAPHLDASWTLADFGCGPGLLDFHLAPMVAKVTAIDSEEVAITELRIELESLIVADRPSPYRRIEPWLCDLRELGADARIGCAHGTRRGSASQLADLRRRSCWDAVVMSFVGVDAQLLDNLIGRARKRALLYFRHRSFDPDAPEILGAPETERHLAERGYSFTKTVTELEFGQPFCSLPDAEEWLADLAKRKEAKARKARESLVETGRSDYPYYLPKTVEVTFFVVTPLESQ